MFVRNCWKPRSEQEVFDLIRQNPWGLLVSNGPVADGTPTPPMATNLPMILDPKRRTLTTHIARVNTHTALLRKDGSPLLAIFEGPASHITASWYPERSMPPTIYYTSVHCHCTLEFQDEPQLRNSLEEITHFYEDPIPNGWQTTDIAEKDIVRRLPAIVGFELKIEHMEAKFKLGQDEPKRDAMAVAERLLASDDPRQRLLGEMTRRYNEDRP